MSSCMAALTQQQQTIESEQHVLNAMSTKIAQLSSQLSVRKLCLDDEMQLMSTTHAAMSAECQQLKVDLATRDFNKIKASVNQLQSCYDTCSRSVISHQPTDYLSDSDVLSSLLEANALLSACGISVPQSFEHVREQKDDVMDVPEPVGSQLLISVPVNLTMLDVNAVCARLSDISRFPGSFVSDDDQQLLVASMLSWTLAQQLNMVTRMQHNIPLQHGFVKLIVDQLGHDISSIKCFVPTCDLLSAWLMWLEAHGWLRDCMPRIKQALESKANDPSGEISTSAFLTKCAMFDLEPSETDRLYALAQRVEYLNGSKICSNLIPKLACFSQLQHLNVRNGAINAAGCQSLGSNLASVPLLTSLNISSNKIGDAGCQSLSSNLASVPLLTSLSISYNQIGDAGCQSLSSSLVSVPLLTSLNIRSNKIGDAGCQSLSSNLASVPLLTSLSISANEIGAAGCQSLSSNLASVPLLTSLSISWNKIGDAGCRSLSSNLASVPLLTSLDIRSNEICSAGFQKLTNNAASGLRVIHC